MAQDGNDQNASYGTSLSITQFPGKGAVSTEISVGYYGTDENILEEANGSLGKGGDADFDGAGGGGSGYFGGSAAYDSLAGGGGGLSYVYQNHSLYSGLVGIEYKLNFNGRNLNSLIALNTKGWLNIKTVEDYTKICDGNDSSMPNPLKYNGTNTMTGNKGNGMVIIKKLSDK